MGGTERVDRPGQAPANLAVPHPDRPLKGQDLDAKKPQVRGFVPLAVSGCQTRPLFFAEDLRLILNRLELNVKPLFLL